MLNGNRASPCGDLDAGPGNVTRTSFTATPGRSARLTPIVALLGRLLVPEALGIDQVDERLVAERANLDVNIGVGIRFEEMLRGACRATPRSPRLHRARWTSDRFSPAIAASATPSRAARALRSRPPGAGVRGHRASPGSAPRAGCRIHRACRDQARSRPDARRARHSDRAVRPPDRKVPPARARSRRRIATTLPPAAAPRCRRGHGCAPAT